MQTTAITASDRAIEAMLRGEAAAVNDEMAFAAAAMHHGVAGLLIAKTAALPPAVRAALLRRAREQAVRAAAAHRELQCVFSALADVADVLVFKGAHLAFELYADPSMRPFIDADLLVRPEQRPAVVAALERLGYEERGTNIGDAALGQATFERGGLQLDVHSRLTSRRVFDGIFDPAALWRRATRAAAFDGRVRVPARPDALAIALAHQTLHHPSEFVLIWSWDVHLLLAAMSLTEASAFAEGAEPRLVEAARVPLATSEARFPTAAGHQILRAWAARPAAEVGPQRRDRRAAWILDDVRAVNGLRAKQQMVRAHLFPPRRYMRHTFRPGSRMPLAILYAARLARVLRPRGPVHDERREHRG